MNMMQCNMFGSQKLPHGTCIPVPFANHIELQIGCAGSPWHRVAWRMEMMLLRKMQSQWGVWLEKKLRVCGMQLWRTRINEKDKCVREVCREETHCNPVSWCLWIRLIILKLWGCAQKAWSVWIYRSNRSEEMLECSEDSNAPGFSLKSVYVLETPRQRRTEMNWDGLVNWIKMH